MRVYIFSTIIESANNNGYTDSIPEYYSAIILLVIRSAMNNSGDEENVHTRKMVFGEEQIVWSHIIECFKADRRTGWSMTRLTSDAVFLNNFSKMKIPLMEKARCR